MEQVRTKTYWSVRQATKVPVAMIGALLSVSAGSGVKARKALPVEAVLEVLGAGVVEAMPNAKGSRSRGAGRSSLVGPVAVAVVEAQAERAA